MNRKQRRQAESRSRSASKTTAGQPANAPVSVTPLQLAQVEMPSSNPSWVARLAATVILRPWIRRRVRHPLARSAVAMLAREVGRRDIADEMEKES